MVSLYAGSANNDEKLENTIEKYKIVDKVNEKGYRNALLTAEQKSTNNEKTKMRARV